MLSVLFSYVGAIEFFFIVRDIIHQVDLHQRQLRRSSTDLDDDLQRIQDTLNAQLRVARLCENENVQCMQDGVVYENGYRVDEDVTNDWIALRKAAVAEETPQQSVDDRSSSDSTNTVIDLGTKTIANGHVVCNQTSSPEIDDNYLRSLDGIKVRSPDSNRRRRTYRQGRSGSSNVSYDEESLDDDYELASNGDAKPSQLPRRRKHSPAQDLSRNNSHQIDEVDDPWGDIKPEPYHNSDLWKKERAMSIPETDDSNHADRSNTNGDQKEDFDRCYSPVGIKQTKKYSFEAASNADHTRALDILRSQLSSDDVSHVDYYFFILFVTNFSFYFDELNFADGRRFEFKPRSRTECKYV